ncbi:MAG: formate dehydrogenase accessory sulfurtransferase FdhD [Chloroflexota bacterium]|nr:formate dehydrogenase accessory sulfurtransferase FdhD [Chloroflexota bacterium]
MTDGRKASTTRVRATVVTADGARRKADVLATEEPLEIRVEDAATGEAIFNHVTMRTPGADFELTAGLLLAEGVIQRADQLRQMEFCVGPKWTAVQQYNIVSALVTGSDPERRAGAHFRTAVSACGVCGKASLDDISLRGIEPLPDGPGVDRDLVTRLPELLRSKQALFDRTGGLHGAALVSGDGRVLAVREDVGRHNAVDKVIGWALLNPGEAGDAVALMVSGRLSFELAQKAVVGRVPVLAGVSAPSSLAVEVADEFNLTLIGFLRGDSFNIYAHPERVSGI